ncbi:MAG: tRNA (adenosine(37)-N6)-threonylcarbamoyltransferase complex dimerization subunit type 1 TsaB [Syntrophobacter sp.]
MRILAADTSSMSGSLALIEDGTIVAEWTLRSAQTHNRRLLGAIDQILDQAAWSLDSVDGFAVTAGPGSFTGLRIGMTTIKTLAWTRGKLYAAVPSLDALAFPFACAALPVCTIIDARKQEVYCALYRSDPRGTVRNIMPCTALSPLELARRITEPVIFCGDAWPLYKNQIKRKLGALAIGAPASLHMLRAGFVGEIAAKRFEKGQSDDPATSIPYYVRPSEAEIRYPQFAEKSSAKPEII